MNQKITCTELKIGDEIWWFQCKSRTSDFYYMRSSIPPDTLELVHDVVTDIKDNTIICWHGTHKPEEIWGKTRQEAWSRLKNEIEKWGAIDGKS